MWRHVDARRLSTFVYLHCDFSLEKDWSCETRVCITATVAALFCAVWSYSCVIIVRQVCSMMNSDSSARYGYYWVFGYWWVVVYKTVFSDVDCQAWWSCVYWLAFVECVCKPYNGPVGFMWGTRPGCDFSLEKDWLLICEGTEALVDWANWYGWGLWPGVLKRNLVSALAFALASL